MRKYEARYNPYRPGFQEIKVAIRPQSTLGVLGIEVVATMQIDKNWPANDIARDVTDRLMQALVGMNEAFDWRLCDLDVHWL